MQLFTSRFYFTGCSHAVTCGLLWCFYKIFVLSFWRHPFTTLDTLVSRCNAKFLQICSDQETNSSISRMAWGWKYFQQIFIFWVNCFIKCYYELDRYNNTQNYRIRVPWVQLIPAIYFTIQTTCTIIWLVCCMLLCAFSTALSTCQLRTTVLDQ